jgi:hypothetical protein
MKEFTDKLIERLEEQHERCINRYGIVGGNAPAMEVKQCIDICNELADEYKVSEMPTGWIPCSERLPKSKVDVLVWDSDQEIHCVAWLNSASKIWYSNDFDIENSKNIVAWMPLCKKQYQSTKATVM